MALIRKRKLTDQQTRRIKKQQQKQQVIDDDELMDGIVIANYGKQLEVQAISLPKRLPKKPTPVVGEPRPFWQAIELHSVWRCHTRTNLSLLATGDKVRLSADPNTGLGRIEAVYDRKTVIFRPDRYHKLKPIASNVDILAIVFAPLPLPSAQLIDRYLVACCVSNIKPLLILNKSDLINDANYHTTKNLLNDYQKLNYDTLITQSNGDLSELWRYLQHKTVIFAGQSGVGKSSLINRLLPNVTQSVNEISTISQLGQHTTTTSRFLAFDPTDLSQGAVIDTPGIREYGLWHLQKEEVLAGFIELAPLANFCRFRDCKHTAQTPNCAMWQAVAKGEVLARRVENLVLLQDETQLRFGN
ncbi:ribosome small subunit-dependent GTPase A [Moraxella macacae 0408225]|uniref:Small ribosomal subunit biogenesis GTPase RsgA n=1 Tax=Moraxella macacae 0408225 TaxID=1230338 RepID=L2F7Q2_9GAMM|nr:ribosome small subunit-dependent GTPase A [Moraxella macacae]ELA08498.1 ribosome small subunit-dependent GTPase A [Moraxella macacae 0408225]